MEKKPRKSRKGIKYDPSMADRVRAIAPATEIDIAVLLDIRRETVSRWAKRYEDFGAAVEYCRLRYVQDLIAKALANKVNWAFAKYLLSALFGVVEKTETKNEIVGKDGKAISMPPTQIVIVKHKNEAEQS